MSGNCASGIRGQGDQPGQRDDDGDDDGQSRPADEDRGDHRIPPSARSGSSRRVPSAVPADPGDTNRPGRMRWMPSTTTLLAFLESAR